MVELPVSAACAAGVRLTALLASGKFSPGRIIVLATLCVALAGCAGDWRDTTGQGRSAARASHDSKVCGREAGYPVTSASATPDEIRAAFARTKVCMVARGWESTERNPQ